MSFFSLTQKILKKLSLFFIYTESSLLFIKKLIIFALFFGNSLFASPVNITFEKVTWFSKEDLALELKVTIQEGWKMLGEAKEQDTLKKPPELLWDTSENIKNVVVSWPESELWHSNGQNAHVYFKEIKIPLRVKLKEAGNLATLALILKGLACSDVCMPLHEVCSIVLSPPQVSLETLCKNNCMHPQKQGSWWEILGFAFLGGMILNFMPCVLPVLGIKLKGFSNARPELFKKICFYTTLGILFNFWVFAFMAITVKAVFQKEFGWGMQFQNPYFITAMILIITLSSMSLLGILHFHAPKWAGRIAPKSSYSMVGAFLSGALSVLLATPCCAPLMGVALGMALTQGPVKILGAFTFIGLGFAFPYLFGMILPIEKYIPKAGKWTLYMERIAGALLLITVFFLFKLLAGFQSGIQTLISVILIAVGSASIIAVNFKKESFSLQLRVLLAYAIPTVCFIAFVLAPWWMNKVFSSKEETESNQQMGLVKWIKWHPEAMKKYLEEGKIVFVDVTAEWCYSCKMNKFMVLNTEPAEKLLSSSDIVAMRADKTFEKGSEAIDTFLSSYGHPAIPFNIVLSKAYPQGIFLSEVLTFSEAKKAIEQIRKIALTRKSSSSYNKDSISQ